ncbi:leucine-rich repeat receptor-like protein kinase family protein [Striga asiatica]|uniref:Leucine-rich repeat receptor-like protein kinase family protein n=1 Tax=Striga asiatica TaxID=4170 RepID=A0A5A7PII2_STRAF|nr:leucine-rich repeat receptor-like protein kinase family protein [Striga asiatica]
MTKLPFLCLRIQLSLIFFMHLMPFSVASLKERATLLDLKQNWGNPPSLRSWNDTSPGLDLSQNNFFGNIPADIDQLQLLEYINLGSTWFTGDIPPAIGNLTRLRTLILNYASFNHLTEISNFTDLENLVLAYNHLTAGIRKSEEGTIPQSIESLDLVSLDLSENKLTGKIPEDFGKLEKLEFLGLCINSLSGEIPQSLGLLPSLEPFKVFMNDLSGILPPEMGSRSRLESFQVSNNHFNGNLPENLCAGEVHSTLWSLINLTSVMLSDNSLSGELPSKTVAPCLSRLEISNNEFSGEIPGEVLPWESLVVFKASNNRLSGPIPKGLTGLRDLSTLLVDGNSLSGGLPSEILSWKSLSTLHLARNKYLVRSHPCSHEGAFTTNSCCDSTFGNRFCLFAICMTRFLVKYCRESRLSTDIKSGEWEFVTFQRLDFNEVDILSSLTEMVARAKFTKIEVGLENQCIAVNRNWSGMEKDDLLEKEFQAEIQVLEYAHSSRVNEKIDIYSFGVVLLELVTGRKPNTGNEDMSLAEWAWAHYGQEKPIIDALDESIKEDGFLEEIIVVFKVGLLCTSLSPSNRPMMSEVLEMLRC